MTRKRLAGNLSTAAAILLATGIFALAWEVSRRTDALTAMDPPPVIGAVDSPVRAGGPAGGVARPFSIDEAAEAFAERLEDVAMEELRTRRLTIPVVGVDPDDLDGTFDELRGSRRHEAIDILAPRHTAVVAVEDGTIARLFFSQAGGTTVYQFDPTIRYVYYYAHLEGYARGLVEKGRVVRGQVIGYVGTSGNAPKDTPHLHFAIVKLTEQKRWWEGAPIDPYAVLTGRH
jgi:murein DD-endopeptidase MepM/ murein hydrolase activator NlpD